MALNTNTKEGEITKPVHYELIKDKDGKMPTKKIRRWNDIK